MSKSNFLWLQSLTRIWIRIELAPWIQIRIEDPYQCFLSCYRRLVPDPEFSPRLDLRIRCTDIVYSPFLAPTDNHWIQIPLSRLYGVCTARDSLFDTKIMKNFTIEKCSIFLLSPHEGLSSSSKHGFTFLWFFCLQDLEPHNKLHRD